MSKIYYRSIKFRLICLDGNIDSSLFIMSKIYYRSIKFRPICLDGNLYRFRSCLFLRFFDLFGVESFVRIGYVSAKNKNKK